MITLYLDTNFRITSSLIPTQIIQYSTDTLELYLPSTFIRTNKLLTFTFIRADGYKCQEAALEYQGLIGSYHKWTGLISQFYTLNLPGTGDTGRAVLNVTCRTIEGELITSIINSPLVRLTIKRSSEPEPEVMEPTLAILLTAKVESLEETVNELVAGEPVTGLVRTNLNNYFEETTPSNSDKLYVDIGDGSGRYITYETLLAAISEGITPSTGVQEIQISASEPTIPTVKVWFKIA